MSDNFCMRLFWHIHNIMICRTIYRSTLHYVTLQLLLSLVAEEELNWYILGNSNFQNFPFYTAVVLDTGKSRGNFKLLILHEQPVNFCFLVWQASTNVVMWSWISYWFWGGRCQSILWWSGRRKGKRTTKRRRALKKGKGFRQKK